MEPLKDQTEKPEIPQEEIKPTEIEVEKAKYCKYQQVIVGIDRDSFIGAVEKLMGQKFNKDFDLGAVHVGADSEPVALILVDKTAARHAKRNDPGIAVPRGPGGPVIR